MDINSRDKEILKLKGIILDYENLADRMDKDPVIEKEDYERQLEELLERALNAEEELEVLGRY